MGASVGIQVGVEGENEYVKSLKNVTAETKAFQSEFKALQSSFGKNASTWDKSQFSASVLTDEINAQYRKLEALQQAQSKFAEGSTKWFEYADKINKATDALNQMEKQLEALPNHIQAIGEDFEKWGHNLENVGKTISKTGDKLTKNVTTPIVGGLAAALKETTDFDTAMSEVKAIAVTTQEALGRITAEEGVQQFETLRNKAREMGRETVYSATESANAMSYLARAGWNTEQIISGVDGVMALAAADGLDLATTASIVADGVTAFGKSADYASHFADILAMTSAQSNTNVEMLGESFKYVAPSAAALGYEVEDVAIALGLSANAGVKASQAGTGLRQALKNLMSPTEKVAEAADKFGVSLYDAEGNALPLSQVIEQLRTTFGGLEIAIMDENGELKDGEAIMQEYGDKLPISQQEKLQALVDIFGTRAMPTMLSIVNAGVDDFNNLQEALYNTQGAAQKMADTRLDNLGGDLTLLKDELLDLAISMGDIMVPVLRDDIVPAIRDVVGWFSSLDEGTKEMIIKAGLFAAAVGPVLSVGGRLITGVGTLTSGIGGILKVVGGLAGTGASITAGIGSVVGAIGAGATGLIGAVGSVISAAGAALAAAAPFILGGIVIAGIVAGLAWLGYQIYKHWDDIKAWTSEMVDKVSKKWDEFKTNTHNAWENMKQSVHTNWENMKTSTREAVDNMWSKIQQGWDNAKRHTHDRFEEMKNSVRQAVENMRDKVHENVNNIVNKFTTDFNTLRDNAISWGSGIVSNLGEGLKSAWSWVSGTVSNIASGISGFFTGLVNNAFSWGSDMMSKLSSGISAGIDWVRDKAAGAAEAIRSFLHFSVPDEGPLSDADSYMPDMMRLMAEGIDNNINMVTGELYSLGNSMNSVFGQMQEEGYNAGTGTVGNIGSGFEQNMYRITNAANNMKMSVTSALASLASSAHSWGSDLAQSMASGIGSAINSVARRAEDVAEAIRSRLHFSVPDKGPLSDADTYMPDFMSLLAGGIYENLNLVNRAADTIAAALVPNIDTGTIPTGTAGGTTVTNGDIVINVYGTEGQDVRELARIVEEEISFNMIRRGLVTA